MYERKAAAVYVGTIWDRSVQPGSDVLRNCLTADFLFGRRDILFTCHGSDGICIYQDVFQEYKQALKREPMVSQTGDEGQELFYKEKEGTGTAKGLSYL